MYHTYQPGHECGDIRFSDIPRESDSVGYLYKVLYIYVLCI